MKILAAIGRLLSREPVALGAAVVAWVAVFGPSEAAMAATVATVGVVQRWLSVPAQKATEQAQDAHEAGGDAREVQITQYLAAKPTAKARAAKKA